MIALVTDGTWDLGVPRFGLDDVEGLAAWLVRAVPIGEAGRARQPGPA